MRRFLFVLVVMIAAITLSGCDFQNTVVSMNSYELTEYEVNDFPDAGMDIVEESVTSKGLTLKLYYYGENEGSTGAWYTLFVDDGSGWNELPDIVDGTVSWFLIAYVVEKNRACERPIDWEWLFGELPAGRYLIVKDFLDSRGTGDYDEYYLACEFTIQE